MDSQSRIADPQNGSAPPAARAALPPRQGRAALEQETVELLVTALRALPPRGRWQVVGALDARAVRDALLAPRAQMHRAAPQDHREAPRARTLRGGKIVFNNRMSVVDCRVLDISESGCRVGVVNAAIVPPAFTLHVIAGNTERECEVVWRKPDELGLRFTD